jgi:hypothetical protein
MLNYLPSAQACIVRGPPASQPAAQGVLDYALNFAVIHGGEDCRSGSPGIKEHNKNT